MIARGAITQRATAERLPAQTIERDYVLAHLCAEIGAGDDARLVFKGGTLLRLCHFREYRYSADLDFSAVGGLTFPTRPPSRATPSTRSRPRSSAASPSASNAATCTTCRRCWTAVMPLRSKPGSSTFAR